MNLKKKSALQASAVAAIVILSAFLLGACAGMDTAPIQQKMAKADSAISDARRSNAINYAPLELKLAEEKLSQARTEFQNKNYQQADWLAEEALADADLAETKTRSVKTNETVQDLQGTIQALQQEIQRQQTP